MADKETEFRFVSIFWNLARKKDEDLARIAQHIKPAMLESNLLGVAYRIISTTHSAGKPLDDQMFNVTFMQEMQRADPKNGLAAADALVEDSHLGGRSIRSYAARVLLTWRNRETVRILKDAAETLEALTDSADGKVAKEADAVATRIYLLHSKQGLETDKQIPVTRGEFTQAELAKLDQGEPKHGTRINLGYSKLTDQMGDLLPGDVMGICAYSNGGKSLLDSNLARNFAIRRYPQIFFPTEMQARWLSRMYASHAKVNQYYAEREAWHEATEAERDAYRLAVLDLEQCPWEIVNQPEISVDEIIARATVLRRKFAGQPVVVHVDHMHRLNYGSKEANLEVGAATRKLANWARSDTDGGIILVLLYQPRKPIDEMELYKPVDPYQVRGTSEVWNEVDYYLSPYRRWVKVVEGHEKNPQLRTPWGTPRCVYTSKGVPEFTKPNESGSKLDDEHVYIKIGKRRVGGEGPTVMLNIDGPTGHIYELSKQDRHLVALP